MAVSYRWEHERYSDAVCAEIERFAAVVRYADPATAVPTCPGWTLADLVRHTGEIHRWAAAMVRDVATRSYRRGELDLGLPDDTGEYPGWLAAGAGPLAEVLRAADPEAGMWAWGADQRARFWARRMLHETTVHRADAELALAAEPGISPEVAADGVDEFFVNLPHAAYFAPNVEKLRGDGETLAFHATDLPPGWRVTLQPDGFRWRREGGPAEVTVRGLSVDLYLLIWGRREPRDVRYAVSGDAGLLSYWVENSVI